MSWWGIVNPGAGRSSTSRVEVETALSGAGVHADLHITTDAGNVAAIVAEGLARGETRFLVVGGDGTVNLVVNALVEDGPRPDVTVAVLPAGSGCDLIRTFGISQDLSEAAHHLAGDGGYPIDVGYVDGPWGRRYFANVASLGLGAAAVKYADRLPTWLGSFRYRVGVWPALVRFRKSEISVAADTREFHGEASLVVLANAQFFGGGMNIAPKASMVDGELDVQVFTGPKRNAVVLQYRINRGTHLTHKAVRRLTGSEVAVHTAAAWEVELDGEFVGVASDVSAGVLPEALRLKI